MVVLPSAEPVAKWHLACEGDGATPSGRKVIYQFTPTPLYPVRRGPRMTERPRTGKPRTWLQLDEAMARAESMLSRCWKWAASRGAPEGTLEIAFTMTPFGQTIAHAVGSPTGKNEELAACLRQNLQHLEISELSPRTTRMRAKVAFVRAAQGKWPTPPQRPVAQPPAPRSKTCVPVLDDAPVDQITSPIEYVVDDFDESRIVRQPGVPTVTIGCTRSSPMVMDKGSIRVAINSNLGAFQACYADARDRDATLAGGIEMVLELADVTTPTKITVTGAGDRALHDCLTAAANEIWLPEALPAIPIEAHVHFELAALEAATDPEAALAKHARALATVKTDRGRCEARARIVEAFAQLAPWLDDRRVLVATKELAMLAATLPEADAIGCLEPIDELLRRIAYGGHSVDARHLRWSWLERIEAVMPIAHRLEWGRQLAWFHAATLALSPTHHAVGVAKLREIAATDESSHVRDLAEGELARYELPKHVEQRHCEKLR